jgi:hypothetical protein
VNPFSATVGFMHSVTAKKLAAVEEKLTELSGLRKKSKSWRRKWPA